MLQKVNCFHDSNETSDDKHLVNVQQSVITTTFAGKYSYCFAEMSVFLLTWHIA